MAHGIARTLALLDAAKLALAAVAAAVVLLYVGAKVEREVMKRRLEVLDGAKGDVDLTKGAASGDRG